MFSFSLIKTKELKKLEEYSRAYVRVMTCQRWFGEFKELDAIWNFILDPNFFDDIGRVRESYKKILKGLK